MLEFARPETGSIDHLRDALRVDTSGGARGRSGVEAGAGASAARSEVALHQTFRAGWQVGDMGTWPTSIPNDRATVAGEARARRSLVPANSSHLEVGASSRAESGD